MQRERTIRTHQLVVCSLVAVLCAHAACRQRGDAVAKSAAQPKPPAAVRPVEDVTDPDRWLTVEKTRADTKGGWATGSFITERNRLVLETKDVQRFSVNTDQININWDKLVVIRIDGVNSELRKRDDPVMRFQRDRHNRWVVMEKE